MSTQPLSATTFPRTDRYVHLRAHYDLLLLPALALLGLALLPLSFPLMRVPLGLALALFAPGYVLVAALFPRRASLDLPARLGLSFGTSIALLPLLALLLDKLPWGIRPWPIACGLAVWIGVLSAVALWRRALLPSSEATAPPPLALGQRWRRTTPRTRRRTVIGGLLAAGLMVYTAAVLLVPPATPTEFYVLGAEGQAQNYPRSASVGEPLSATIGVVNGDDRERTFQIEVWGRSLASPEQRTLVQRDVPFTLLAGQQIERELRWSMLAAGPDQQAEIVLLVDGQAAPYRTLRLWLDVSAP